MRYRQDKERWEAEEPTGQHHGSRALLKPRRMFIASIVAVTLTACDDVTSTNDGEKEKLVISPVHATATSTSTLGTSVPSDAGVPSSSLSPPVASKEEQAYAGAEWLIAAIHASDPALARSLKAQLIEARGNLDKIEAVAKSARKRFESR